MELKKAPDFEQPITILEDAKKHYLKNIEHLKADLAASENKVQTIKDQLAVAYSEYNAVSLAVDQLKKVVV